MPNLHVFLFFFIPLLLGINSMMTQSGLAGNNAHAAERNRWGPGIVCCLYKCVHASRSAGDRQFCVTLIAVALLGMDAEHVE